MMCDIIYAGEKAKFGQPEILIGNSDCCAQNKTPHNLINSQPDMLRFTPDNLSRNNSWWRGHSEADQGHREGKSHGDEPHRSFFPTLAKHENNAATWNPCSKSNNNCVHCSGRPINASEAASYGLVAKVFPVEQLVEEAVKTADHIAGLSQVPEKIIPFEDPNLIVDCLRLLWRSLKNQQTPLQN